MSISFTKNRRGFQPRLLRKTFVNFCLCSHAVFKRTGSEREAEIVAHIDDTVGPCGVEIAIGAFGFHHQRSGRALHDFTIALWVTGLDQQFGIANHVQVAAWEISELHRAFLPVVFHRAHGHARTDDKVFHVGGVDAISHFQETGLKGLAFPAVGRVSVNTKTFEMRQTL